MSDARRKKSSLVIGQRTGGWRAIIAIRLLQSLPTAHEFTLHARNGSRHYDSYMDAERGAQLNKSLRKSFCCLRPVSGLDSPQIRPVEVKDIAIATLSAASAIAALLLVFVGFMIMKMEGLPSEVADRVIAKYKRAAKWGLLPFLAQSVVICACYAWMFCPNTVLLHIWTVGFALALVLFIAYSVIITVML